MRRKNNPSHYSPRIQGVIFRDTVMVSYLEIDPSTRTYKCNPGPGTTWIGRKKENKGKEKERKWPIFSKMVKQHTR